MEQSQASFASHARSQPLRRRRRVFATAANRSVKSHAGARAAPDSAKAPLSARPIGRVSGGTGRCRRAEREAHAEIERLRRNIVRRRRQPHLSRRTDHADEHDVRRSTAAAARPGRSARLHSIINGTSNVAAASRSTSTLVRERRPVLQDIERTSPSRTSRPSAAPSSTPPTRSPPEPAAASTGVHRCASDGLHHRCADPGGDRKRARTHRLDAEPVEALPPLHASERRLVRGQRELHLRLHDLLRLPQRLRRRHGDVLYTNQPYTDTSGLAYPQACDSGQHPNGDWADATLNVIEPRAQRGDHRPERKRLVRLLRERERGQVRLELRYCRSVRPQRSVQPGDRDRQVLPTTGVEQRIGLMRLSYSPSGRR